MGYSEYNVIQKCQIVLWQKKTGSVRKYDKTHRFIKEMMTLH